MPKNNPNIVVIGGGTGSFTLLRSLKDHTSNITALVNMADDGGSTGVLRDELGVLPPGDIRQCLVALSDASEELRELFTFRFPAGTFEGHSFGNIFLSAVESMTSDFNDSVRIASDILRITGKVLPITVENCQLVMKHYGKTVTGEYAISQTKLAPHTRPELSLLPVVRINPAAAEAISAADLVVIAPGNLYGSLAPALLVQGVADAIQSTNAPLAFVCNLVNKPHSTAEFSVHDYAEEIERFTGKGTVDYVLYNTDMPSKTLLEKYAVDQEYPVHIDANQFKAASYKPIGGAFLSHDEQSRNHNDHFITRSLIRHDSHAIAHALIDLLK